MSGSKKRPVSGAEGAPNSKRGAEKAEEVSSTIDELEFEDPYGDEYEDEDEEEEIGDAGEASAEMEADAVAQSGIDAAVPPPKQVWRPGIDKLQAGEELDYDPSAYIMYHALRTEWPCLSFDIIRDNLGDSRQRFPLTMYMVTGSQADREDRNKVTLLKVSDLNKTHVKADSDSEDEDDDEDADAVDEDPTIEHINVNHPGGVNRIRSMPQAPGVVATMADTSAVHVFDLRQQLASMMSKGPRVTASTRPAFSYSGHEEEGFALDWSPTVAGRLATGDCAGNIRIWQPAAGAAGADVIGSMSWTVQSGAFKEHLSSVEDLQWSPTEASVFISASADKTVRVWDIRDSKKAQIAFQAHEEDVNVISWNKNVGYLLASGSDDGSFKVWDLRNVKSGGAPLAHFTYHRAPITSIEWAPHDESMIALTSADDQLTIWDLSVEADDDAAAASADAAALADYPPQLLFIHQGQSNMKEVHFHPQIHGALVSTAEDGFNIFKPAITIAS